MKNVLAFCGSIRKIFSNRTLIQAAGVLAKDVFRLLVYNNLEKIPVFNPDPDTESPPATILHFPNQLGKADGVFICTPVYAMGVPAVLKNAIDRALSSCEFSHNPLALISDPSAGENDYRSLLKTLTVIESKMKTGTQLLIPFIKTKINSDTMITDQKTLAGVKKLIDAFYKLLNE